MNEHSVVQREARRAERIQRRRRQILDAAARLMQRTGYHAMSVQQLAEAADVSVGLIYQYFGGKLELLEAVIVDILRDFEQTLPERIQAEESPEEQLAGAVRAYCEIIDAKREAAVLAYRESATLPPAGLARIKELELRTVQPIRQIVVDGLARGSFRAIDPELVAHTVLMIAHGWALKHWNVGARMSLDAYVRQETSLLLHGLAT
ncbi:MAG TPA: TetR family transcriptional regulator [Ornithinicoccus sp.]|jgi:AcrR family transcriptional regulator|nr:TetR family transcriptional regulator [Ornithinicoccus sp.]